MRKDTHMIFPPHSRIAAGALLASTALLIAGCADSTTPLSGRQNTVRSTDTNVSFNNCGSACTGEIDGARYAIKLPTRWNGTLLLYSHGYRFAEPGPPNFDPINTNAQVSSTDENGTGEDPLSKQLLSEGYALAGSSYKSNGWAVADGVAAGEALHAKFVKLVGTPKRTYVWGDSLGGLITEVIAETNPSWVDGAAPMCGAVAGPNLNFDAALDVSFAIKTLIDPALKLTGYTSIDDANANWKHAAAAVVKAASDTASGGTAKVLFIAGLVNAPGKTMTYDGHDITSQVKATVESLLTALAFGTAGRYELEQRVGGNPSGNVGNDYTRRISDAEAGLVTTVGGNVTTYEKALADAPRVTPDAAARQAFEKLGDTTGVLRAPTLTMHTENDPLVLVANESVFAGRVLAKDAVSDLVQLYVEPPATYSEAAGAPYGAGHCNFSDEQRLGLIATLNAWVHDDVYPVPVGVAPAFGAGLDPSYAPGPWPSGATT
jgi:pimeloyl-ACP methyl ester carboxylesterase